MVSKTPITRQTIAINATVQETGGPTGGARLSAQVARELRNKRDNYQTQAIENAYLKGQTVLTEEMARIEKQHSSDPDTLAEALEEYGSSFLDDISDPNMAARFELQMSKTAQSAIARATANRQTIINEQARFDNLQAFEAMKGQIPSIGQGLLSEDNAIALSAAEELQELLMRGGQALGATDGEGIPLFNAAFRSNQLTDIKDVALQSAVESWLEGQPDKVTALETFESGELVIQLPNADGDFDSINVRDAISPQTAKLITTAAKAQITQEKALQQQMRNVSASNIELAIETAQDDQLPDPSQVGPHTPVLTKAQKLNNILQSIDNNPIYSDTPEGIVKGNDLRKKVFQKLEKEQEKYESITSGSAFAGGQAFLNRQDSKAVKAYNDYYEAIEPGLSQLQPFERNMAITDMVDKAKAVPSRLTGDIQRIARSRDVEQIKQAADLLDRIGAQNPHLIGDIAPQNDLARIQMINDRVNQGYTEDEAIQIVDTQLDPRNQITLQEANAELKEKKVDYRGQAVQAFDSAGLFKELFTLGQADGLDPDSARQQPIVDGLTASYRVAYEDHYRITRDEKLSKEYAEKFVKGRYGVTKVNGKNMIMQYTPEKYYSISGEDNKWMREQMLDTAQDILKDSLNPPNRRDIKKNLILMSDPFVTPRTAKQGAPRYKLMYKREDGTLSDVLGPNKYFYFEPDKRKAKLIEEAVQSKEQYDLQQQRRETFEPQSIKEGF